MWSSMHIRASTCLVSIGRDRPFGWVSEGRYLARAESDDSGQARGPMNDIEPGGSSQSRTLPEPTHAITRVLLAGVVVLIKTPMTPPVSVVYLLVGLVAAYEGLWTKASIQDPGRRSISIRSCNCCYLRSARRGRCWR